MSCLFVIFIGSWILPLRFLKLLRSPCVDKIKRYERRRDAKDARPSSAQNVGDALAEVVREGALLEGRQAVDDHMPHPCQMPKLAAHGHRGLEVTSPPHHRTLRLPSTTSGRIGRRARRR